MRLTNTIETAAASLVAEQLTNAGLTASVRTWAVDEDDASPVVIVRVSSAEFDPHQLLAARVTLQITLRWMVRDEFDWVTASERIADTLASVDIIQQLSGHASGVTLHGGVVDGPGYESAIVEDAREVTASVTLHVAATETP